MRTKILISSAALVAIALSAIIGFSTFIFRTNSKDSPDPNLKMNEIINEYRPELESIDKDLAQYNIRLIPVQREFETGDDIIVDAVRRSIGAAVASIIIIASLSFLFTYFASKKITVPLSYLADGAKRIGEGDFSTSINYKSKDEFGEVCIAFNQMQEKLLEAQERTTQMEQARIDMIADISHDLRTPLTSVKGYIKGIQDGITNTPEKRERYLETAYRRACDMDILLERLFFISKVESGTLPINKELVDFAQIIEDYVFIASPELETANAEISTEITDKPCMLRLDYGQIQRTLSNFVENSVKYSNTDNLKILIKLEHDPNVVTLTYSDNGKGVTDEQLPHIFDRFWRGDKARSEADGSGLGLYICKHIANSHGASIEAFNDNGLKFVLKFPRKDD